MSNKSYKYSVAGRGFELLLPEDLVCDKVLGRYKGFEDKDAEVLTTIIIRHEEDLQERIDRGDYKVYNEEPPYIWIDVKEESASVGFSNNPDRAEGVCEISKDLKQVTLYVPQNCSAEKASFLVNNVTMLAFTYATSSYSTLTIHASVIKLDGKAYAFLGKSGTGKSTHSRLWLENVEGAILLNDDNPIVYLQDDKVYISGSPWSGKTPCYKNEQYPLGGIVRLTQAPYNRIERQRGVKAYASLLPSCSCMKWDKAHSDELSDTIAKVITDTPVWYLECLPDAQAAILCSETIKQ